MSLLVQPLSRDDLPAARRVLRDGCELDDADRVAEEKLFESGATAPAVPLGAFDGAHLAGVAVASGRWLRLLAVAPEARNRGVGSALLDRAERVIRDDGHDTARTLDQPGNYLSPGIDARNEAAIAWLESRGYRRRGTNTNLIIDVVGNPEVSAGRALELADGAERAGCRVRRAETADAERILPIIEQAFSSGWAFEIRRALAHTPAGVHIALDRTDGQLAAFAAHDGNNRGIGWFGPAGTLEQHRGKGLGSALLLACLVDVAEMGLATCTIAWIGPRAFYERVAGVQAERSFVVLDKSLA